MIALFDSGFGGLTVLKPILRELPDYDYLYLGDNARAPYGNHSPETILKYSREAVQYLFNRGAKLIVFACNTASSVALRTLQEEFLNGKEEKERKILGVIIPVAEEIASLPNGARVGLVGTRATINSEAYSREILSINPSIKLCEKACPLLVPLIEEGWHKTPDAFRILKKYLRSIKSANVEHLVLACTHYKFMEDDFRRIMGKKVKIHEAGEITALSLKDYLLRHPEIESKLTKNRSRLFETTDSPASMKSFIERNLGMKIKMPSKIILDRK
ncbi:MAG: glutamate racemase [Candidatus Gracilibacteria bacterium]|jgi:glutamate racemase|nr:glutamate racemase [Candidatus Gracilibacteria bacterium]